MPSLLLDTNIWNAIADEKLSDEFLVATRAATAEVKVSAIALEEIRAREHGPARKNALTLICSRQWDRLPSGAYLESEEIKSVVRALRPQWLIKKPNLTEVLRYKQEWTSIGEEGIWEQAARDIPPTETAERVRSRQQREAARERSRTVRNTFEDVPLPGLDASTHLQKLKICLNGPIPRRDAVVTEYWRFAGLTSFREEMSEYISEYRRWLDSELDAPEMLRDISSLRSLWLHEAPVGSLKRQWLRGSIEYLQGWQRVTKGNPGDSEHAAHLVDADYFVSADKNFVRSIDRCHAEAPFPTAQGIYIPKSADGVKELMALLPSLKATNGIRIG